MAKKLKVTWVVSQNGTKSLHRRTIRALGLHRLHETVEHDDTPAIRGMLHQVSYMVRVDEEAG